MAETRGNPADTYIGSLISLTSKSEIRYEGLLYTVDTEDSNIALQNVRSFGTEGRKQNGPQIPASDKVYEFIIFRGTDIKDLQVKMSPPPPSIHNDPAIISLQQAAQPPQPISAPPPPPPPYAPPVADLMGNASSTYKGGSVPYYLTANSNVPLWTPPPPPPGPSGNMPAYWQGYYRPQEEHRLLQPFVVPAPPPPLSQVAPSAASASAPALAPAPATSGPQTLATPGQDPLAANASQSSSNQTPSQTPLLSALTQLGSSSMPEGGFSMPLAVSSALPQSSSSASEPCAPEHDNTDFTTQSPSKSHDSKARPLCDARSAGPSGASSNSRSLSVPSPATQASRKSGSASGKGSMVYKQVIKQAHGVKQPLTSGHCVNMPPAAQPLLPLPVSPVQHNALFQMADRASRFNMMRRGRGRGGLGRAGRGGHSRSKVLDDFDFIAMNEKFNKEEVWDELLKVGSKERTGNVGDGSDVDYEARETGEALDHNLLEISRKSVYVKDDFFDSLSCDALDKGPGRSERPKFSEQRKIDAETFGTFQVRTYRSGGGGGYRGKRGAGGGGRGGGQGRGVNRGRGHGFGFFNVNRHGDGRARHAG